MQRSMSVAEAAEVQEVLRLRLWLKSREVSGRDEVVPFNRGPCSTAAPCLRCRERWRRALYFAPGGQLPKERAVYCVRSVAENPRTARVTNSHTGRHSAARELERRARYRNRLPADGAKANDLEGLGSHRSTT